MRGEHVSFDDNWGIVPGSPPHARGALIFTLGAVATPGITPACAGSTFALFNGCMYSKDHPRMRGEH